MARKKPYYWQRPKRVPHSPTSTTRQLADRYREQLNRELAPLEAALLVRERGSNPHAGRRARAAYWKAYRRIHDKIMPRGSNFVLQDVGMI